jgi:RNA polymerase sigma-70 factor, ECF subfamily
MSILELEKVSDFELIERVAKGDVAAYGRLYDRYVEQIYRFIYFRVNSRQETEDIVEVVFLKTFEQVKYKGLKIEKLKPWLYRTANNLVIDYYRSRKELLDLEQADTLSNPENVPESIMIEKQEHYQLWKALETLEPKMQQVIIYRFVNRLSHEETAQIMELKVEYLRVLQYRALQKLRKVLEEKEQHE